ncbi:MAG: transketolase [Spirochaetaceae bacterium]|nr:MAG: transketolase [Spirochaetaceae bacterium]
MNTKALEAIALSVRTLSMDAVQAANSGHPGMPMGLAELGALLYGEILSHYPGDPGWPNRDRLILSAGHGSMFLYSLLHLSGYDVSLDDLRSFRQVGSRTPGHPEYGHTAGVETTTGPLGQGVANAVGMAIAESMLAEHFNTRKHTVIDHYTYAIAGDGCMMEGISSEACSLAGHLGLGKLIVFYDSNGISIEGSTELAFTEDVEKRFEAYGWQVLAADAYDVKEIERLVELARNETAKPTLIKLTSIIGKGSPNKAGSADVHGAALGEEEVLATRRALGVGDNDAFYIDPDAVEFFSTRLEKLKREHDEWQEMFVEWAEANPELKQKWDKHFSDGTSLLMRAELPEFAVGDTVATRKASGQTLQALAKSVPHLVGGSADLAPSNNTALPGYGSFTRQSRNGRTLHFGVREHAMGAICNGLSLHGGFRPFCATFLVFTDYMRPAMRLSALMKQPVIYIMTHDSIFLGEDGPTHQPIEHLAAMRSIPNMLVLRPGDAQETSEAWQMALENSQGPTVLALTRQNLTVYEKADASWTRTLRRGAYIVQDCDGVPDVVVVATGSEVNLALEAAAACTRQVRVVSMISRELFQRQDRGFRESIVPSGVRAVVAELGVAQGWEGFVRDSADLFVLSDFGASGPAARVAEHFGFTRQRLSDLIDA